MTFRTIRSVLCCCIGASLAPAGLAAQDVAVAPNVYVNCQWRVAAIFPGQPTLRDISYTNGGQTVPAREFSFERGMDRYSVTVADFSGVAPEIDDRVVENAVADLRRRGEVRVQYPEDYTPGLPGRQLNITASNGKQFLGNVYMADHRLYITETYATPGDFAALQFEQSVLLLDGTGRDLNNVANRQHYACEEQPVRAETAADLVREAVAAEGGAAALRALNGLSIKGSAKFWEPGQSLVAGGEPRFLGDATFTTTWNLASGMARTEWDRDQQYPPPAAKLKFAETLTPATGFVTGDKGSQPMSGIRIAAQLRELERASPRLLVKAMDSPGNLRAIAPQMLGDRFLPAVSFADSGTEFVILFDPATHLPAAIRTRDDDNIAGDSDYNLVLGDWTPVANVRVAKSLSYRLNGVAVANLTYDTVAANPAVPANTFAVPAAIQAALKPPAAKDVPYQWVLRRLFLTRLLDSDTIIYPAGGGLKLVERIISSSSMRLTASCSRAGSSTRRKQNIQASRSNISCLPIITWTTRAGFAHSWPKARRSSFRARAPSSSRKSFGRHIRSFRTRCRGTRAPR